MDEKDQSATNTILDSIAEGVFTVDKDWLIRSFNRAAEHITGVSRSEAVGRRCCDIFRASICESSCALRQTMTTGEAVVNKIIYIINSRGERIPVSISTALLKDEEGRVVGGVETFRDLRAIEHLRRKLEKRYSFQDIISKNSRMQEIFDVLPGIAESGSNIVIEGESGTGKELIARAIHDLSTRKKGPVVTINCGALPDSLLEAELFGYKKGAFTGAYADKPGRFALADGGTIFLDEIGDVSEALQVRLLRILEEKTYVPLGGTESMKSDARVISATNKNLERLVASGRFREDLYYRINVIKLHLPPLRERREDIPLLIDHFIAGFNSMKNRAVADISPSALATLMNHEFPGNVRELQNILEHALVLCRGSLIRTRDLPDYLKPAAEDEKLEAESMDELQTKFIVSILRKNNWNRSAAADELGIHKTTLWRKMKRLGIEEVK